MEEDQELTKRERQKLNREKKSSEEKSSGMQNKLVVVGAIVALAVGAFWFMYRGGGEKKNDTPETQVTSPSEVSSEDHTKGPENALITLVEYGDFQCPACGAYHPIVNQISDEFKEDLKFVYRNFPLKTIHKNAQIAAQAAEAAAVQGKFWEMHDVLYERQEDWSNARDPKSMFIDYAKELSLDTDVFENDINSAEVKAKVDADYNGGFAAGINSTPTFYINGEKVSNLPQGLDSFRQLIQEAIDKAKEGKESATPEASASSAPENSDIVPSL